MRRADQLHGDLRIDDDHDDEPLVYPLSICASMSSIWADGKSWRTAVRATSSFLPEVSRGLTLAGRVEGLADPLGDRHAPRACRTLNFAVVRIL
jgi:hypothetical protein